MQSAELRISDDLDAAQREIEALGGHVPFLLGASVLVARLPAPAALQASRAAADGELPAWMSLLVEAWQRVDTLDEASAETSGLVARGPAAPDEGAWVVAVVFVWPRPGAVAADQQRDLFARAVASVQRTVTARPVRVVVEHVDMEDPSWALAKRGALVHLGGHTDTKGYGASLLTCDASVGRRPYDGSLVFFFAPYRLRRSHALIIREERHCFRRVSEPHVRGNVERHVSMVRLAKHELTARSG